jgi:hypothetical protein
MVQVYLWALLLFDKGAFSTAPANRQLAASQLAICAFGTKRTSIYLPPAIHDMKMACPEAQAVR